MIVVNVHSLSPGEDDGHLAVQELRDKRHLYVCVLIGQGNELSISYRELTLRIFHTSHILAKSWDRMAILLGNSDLIFLIVESEVIMHPITQQ